MDNDPLKLRNLPASTPPEDLWPAIAADLDAARGDEDGRPMQATPGPARWMVSAAAASLLAAIVVFSAIDAPPGRPSGEASADLALAQARAESAGLERLLRRQRSGVIDASSVESLAWMENELGWLDLQLADSPARTDLWQQRVELLEQMNLEYERNSWQARFQLASY